MALKLNDHYKAMVFEMKKKGLGINEVLEILAYDHDFWAYHDLSRHDPPIADVREAIEELYESHQDLD